MYSYIDLVFKTNNLYGCNYAEPFAGGSGLALRLLLENKVNNIFINDLDKSIYSFWYSLLNFTDEFCEKIDNTEISVDEWSKQKQIQEKKESSDLFSLGFSTFFLNRTNRSGIINARPIGGLDQKGKYKIDCRFNKKNLIKLIQKISEYGNRIFLSNYDGEIFLKSNTGNSFFYFIDPPYYKNGQRIYENYFSHKDHLSLSKIIKKFLLESPFIITYDDEIEVIKLYPFLDFTKNTINYSLNIKRKEDEILFYNKITLPREE